MPDSLASLNASHPWNQAALLQLQRLSLRPDPSLLYLLQLLRWLLETPEGGLMPHQRMLAEAQLEILERARPEEALLFFQSPDDPEEVLLDQEALESEEPLEAAWEVLAAMLEKLQSHQSSP